MSSVNRRRRRPPRWLVQGWALAATMVGVALYKGWKMRRAWMRQSQS
jgi:hypothetical protein